MPVEATAYTNAPSASMSRACTAFQRSSSFSVMVAIMA
jgi:hypothetical protein